MARRNAQRRPQAEYQGTQRPSVLSLRWIGALIAAIICVVGVFILPWLLPHEVQPVVSEAQVAGFTNRAAMIAIGLAVVVAFSSADWRRAGSRPFVMFEKASEPIGNLFVGAAAVVTLVLTAAVAFAVGGHPYGEAGYFVDRAMYLANGSNPYTGFEFSYGPLLLYPHFWLWVLLRPLGISGANAYYLVLAAVRVGTLFMLAWVLNRLDGSRWLRRATFLGLAVFAALQLGMGLQYTLLRFATPIFLLLWVLEAATREAPATDVAIKSVVAIVIAFLLSPEIGIALLVGLFASCSLLVFKRVPGAAWALTGVGFCAAVFLLAVRFLGTFLGFAGGGYYLPVIASPVVVLFLSAFILVASAAGQGLLRLTPRVAAAQLGWVVSALVLAVAAFGRADFAHVVWNGLAVFIAAAIVLWQWRPRVSAVYVVVFAATILVTLVRFTIGIEATPLLAQVVASKTLTVAQAMEFAQELGVPQDGLRDSLDAGAQSGLTDQQAQRLLALRDVALPSDLPQDIAWGLATRHTLVDSYTGHESWVSWSDASRSMQLMDGAKVLIVPLAQSVAAAQSPVAGVRPSAFMVSPATVSNPDWNGYLYGVPPFEMIGKNSELDIQSVFDAYLTYTWRPSEQVGSYMVLVKSR